MKTKEVDGRVKPGYDDPYSGVRIFVPQTHRDGLPLGFGDVIFPSKISNKAQSLSHAPLFCYICDISLK
jgi:hypothetical protein